MFFVPPPCPCFHATFPYWPPLLCLFALQVRHGYNHPIETKLFLFQTEYKYCYDLVLHYVLHYLHKDDGRGDSKEQWLSENEHRQCSVEFPASRSGKLSPGWIREVIFNPTGKIFERLQQQTKRELQWEGVETIKSSHNYPKSRSVTSVCDH